MVEVGCQVRIKQGVCGEGYRFVVTEILPGYFGETQVYGHNFGPQRLTEVEVVLTKEQYAKQYGPTNRLQTSRYMVKLEAGSQWHRFCLVGKTGHECIATLAELGVPMNVHFGIRSAKADETYPEPTAERIAELQEMGWTRHGEKLVADSP